MAGCMETEQFVSNLAAGVAFRLSTELLMTNRPIRKDSISPNVKERFVCTCFTLLV